MMSATVNDNGIGSSPTEGLSFYSFSSRVSCLTYQRLTFSGVNPVHSTLDLQYIHQEETFVNKCLKYILLTSVISL